MTISKNTKRIVVALFALLMVVCVALSTGIFGAKADAVGETQANGNFYMAGMSVRYEQDDDGKHGVRFGTMIKKSWLDDLSGQVNTGTIIVPKAKLTTFDFAGIMAKAQDDTAIVIDTTDNYYDEGEYYLTKVYLHSIPQAGYNADIVAISYVMIDGEVAYYTAEPCVNSIAGVAKYLLDNELDTEHETELDAYLLDYMVTYLGADGSELQTEYVKYGETSNFTGTVPSKEDTPHTKYFNMGYEDNFVVKGSKVVAPRILSYLPIDNYIYCAGEEFSLPTQEGTDLDAYNLTYEFNGGTIAKGQKLTMATPGLYDYVINVEGVGTIETQVEVLSEEEYQKNYFRTNSTQFFTGVGSIDGRIIVNGNNALSIEEDGSYKYTATCGNTWDDRISLSDAFVGGTSNQWNLDAYNTISMQIKLGNDFTPSALQFNIQNNAHSNANKMYPLVVYDANWSIVPVANMQKGVWYTVVGDLQYASNVETNSFRFYIFNGEKGSLYFKNIMFDSVDHVSMIMGGSARGKVSVVQLDEATYGRNIGAYKIEQTGATWDGHLGLKFYNDASAGGYYAYDLYVESSSLAAEGKGCGLYAGNAGEYNIYDAQGNKIAKADVELGKWYTVIMTYRASEYYYHGQNATEVSYVANPRIVKGFNVWQKVDVTPTSIFEIDNGQIVDINQKYAPTSPGWGARIGFTKNAIDTYLSYQAKNTTSTMYQMKMDVVFGEGTDNNFQFWYYNSTGSMKAVTFTSALSEGWMDMVDAEGNSVTTWQEGVKYTFIVNTIMDLGSNSTSTEHGLQLAMKTTAREIVFSNLRFEPITIQN